MSTSHIEPPTPFYSQMVEGRIRQHYRTYDDALLAAAYSQGYLTSADPTDGAWVVEWDLRT